jgi:arginine decarboxylase
VDVCTKNDIPHPNIITESGRSLTAHHSVLVINVLETTHLPIWNENETISEDDHELTIELYNIWDKINPTRVFEDWHDAIQIREEALELFSLGLLDLVTRAKVERLFWSVARDVAEMTMSMKHPPEELRKVTRMLPEKYFCNFSLFQSLPDSWAIDQMFPIMPIQRLDEKPTRIATIQDITCDSDGKVAHFVSPQGTATGLPLHPLKANEPYYIGVFLVGAYQEILGDLHNLFGDTNAVHISVNKDGYVIEQVIDGETVADVLDYVEYNPKKMVRNLESWVSASMKKGVITAEEGRQFLNTYKSGLYGITYLER